MFGSIFSSMIDGIFSAHRDSANRTIQNKQLELAEKEYYSNLDLMLKNFGLQQEAFNYNKEQAELTRQREDNAFQRRVQDYVKAGFSPLAAQGVAGSSQAPTLTAPQYDPSGVNQATSNRLNAYQNAIANNNQTAQLKLQQQQLKLAQLETVKSMAESVFSIKGQILNNDRLKSETDWYNTHGYRDTTLQTLLSDFINGFSDSYGGNARDFGKWSADRIQSGWNNMLKESLGLETNSNKPPVNNFDRLYKRLQVKKNVKQNNAINNPKPSDFKLLTHEKVFNTILDDISKLSSWSKATIFRKQSVKDYLDSLDINYNKDLFNKSILSNDDVKYLQDLLINYRRSILGY